MYQIRQRTYQQLPREGDLQDFKLADLLLSLEEKKFSGKLLVSQQQKQFFLFFKNGRITVIRSNLLHLLTGQMFVRLGLISKQVNQKFSKSHQQLKRKFVVRYGAYLQEMKEINRQQLNSGLERIMLYRLLSLISWRQGKFKLTTNKNLIEEVADFSLGCKRIISALEKFLNSEALNNKSVSKIVGNYRAGDIGKNYIFELLRQIRGNSDSGILSLKGVRGEEKKLHFLKGRIKEVTSIVENEKIVNILVALGFLEKVIAKLIINDQKNSNEKIGQVLIGKKIITQRQLDKGLALQLTLRFLDIFGWHRGSFSFEKLFPVTCSSCLNFFLLTEDHHLFICESCRQSSVRKLGQAKDNRTEPITKTTPKRQMLRNKEQILEIDPQQLGAEAEDLELLELNEVTIKKPNLQKNIQRCKDCQKIINSASKICPSCWIARRREKDAAFNKIVKKVNKKRGG